MNLLKFYNKVPKISSVSQNQSNREDNADQEIDNIAPKSDPAERTPILEYHPNHCDEIRRAYIQGGPCQPRYHDFPQSDFSGFKRRFNPIWFDDFNWLEHSVSTDAASCLPCYLFKGESIHQGGGDVFSSKGFRNWNRKECFKKHVGLPNSIHNQAIRNCDDLMRQQQSIIAAFDKQYDQTKHEYWLRLNASQLICFKEVCSSGELVLLVSNILNVLGASFKRVDEFRDSQNEKFQEALDMDELKTGRGLNQKLGLVRAGDTRWGSHYKSFGNFICMFGSIVDVLDTLVEDANILGITNELNVSLQKKEQDIANVMLLVQVAKKRLQTLRRDDEWDLLVDKISIFCIKHDILVSNFDYLYVNSGRSRRKPTDYTVFHHYRVDVFCKVLDWQLQEHNDRFDERTTDLLHGVACLNPIDSFSSSHIRKIMKMAELYPDDFDEYRMSALENQLASYIIDVRDFDERFSNLNGLSDLSKRLETKKHSAYPLVFLLVKLASLLPVATATVERTFSAMKFIKNDFRNRMDGDLLGGLVPYVEREVFSIVSNESIIKTFQEMKPHRVQLDLSNCSYYNESLFDASLY
ncbi:PREDICTED: uncharacterized protein LOC109224257 [Nicotiana attenuata]|uniref:uncharacterized protein LOC109224257 n=1 Tax=Nicotiana attenuata TaxID=49451 RepID=UPI0009049771|nr:PREDICTED: uncharacterized protein LOC109224257 [Nicotiana attenuata]